MKCFLLLAICLHASAGFRLGRQLAPSHTEVPGDMPFKIVSEEFNLQPSGALNLTSRYECHEPIEISFTYLPIEYEDTDIQDVTGDSVWHQCVPNEGPQYEYSCISVLQVENYLQLPRELGTVLGLKNDHGIFYAQHRIYADHMADYITMNPYTSTFPPTYLHTHPPPKVYFTPGQDVILEWKFMTTMPFIVEIDRITFSGEGYNEEELMDLGSPGRHDHHDDTIGKIHISSWSSDVADTIIQALEPSEEDRGMKMYTSRIIIQNAAAEDVGIYMIAFGLAQYSVLTELVIDGETSAYPEQPIIAEFDSCQLRRNVLKRGEDMCIECIAVGQNIEDVRLLHDGQIVTSTEGRTFSKVGMLPERQKASYVVPIPSDQDSGEYVCEVLSTDGGTTSQSLSTLFIGEDPEIDFRLVEEYDEMIVLECDATDLPELDSHLAFKYYEPVPQFPGSSTPTIFDSSQNEFSVEIEHEEGSLQWHGLLVVDKTSSDFDDSNWLTYGCVLVSDIDNTNKYVNVRSLEE